MVKRILILVIIFVQVSVVEAQMKSQCIPAFEFIPFDDAATWAKPDASGRIDLGAYSRVSPDGQYILRSLSGQFLSTVTVMKLPDIKDSVKKAKAIETSFDNEAFAVQNTWRFLVEINRQHHQLNSVVTSGKQSHSDFKAGVLGFYTTAAEMSDQNGVTTIRSLSWPNNDQNSGQGQLYSRIYQVRKGTDSKYKVVDETGNKYLCNNLRKTEGMIFTLPMLSMDGREFSAMPVNPKDKKPTTRIYRVLENNEDCELVDDLKVTVSKLIFGPTIGDKKGLVSYFAGNIYVYDRILKSHLEISGFPNSVNVDGFPGFTRDGRIVVAAHWNECSSGQCKMRSGYIRIDPYQTTHLRQVNQSKGYENHYPSCITYDEVTIAKEWVEQRK